jgi:hypothetical protein
MNAQSLTETRKTASKDVKSAKSKLLCQKPVPVAENHLKIALESARAGFAAKNVRMLGIMNQAQQKGLSAASQCATRKFGDGS